MTRRPVVPRVVRGCEPHGPDCVVLRVHARGDGPKWEIDHVKPISQGGTNHVGNLSLCHAKCNNDQDLEYTA